MNGCEHEFKPWPKSRRNAFCPHCGQGVEIEFQRLGGVRVERQRDPGLTENLQQTLPFVSTSNDEANDLEAEELQLRLAQIMDERGVDLEKAVQILAEQQLGVGPAAETGEVDDDDRRAIPPEGRRVPVDAEGDDELRAGL
jgi:hypothetical protein